jgi:hypothetical protein
VKGKISPTAKDQQQKRKKKKIKDYMYICTILCQDLQVTN